MKTLSELEREAYISGNTVLAKAITDHMDTIEHLENVTMHVNEGCPCTEGTEDLWNACGEATEYLRGIPV